ncbi:MAG: alpha-(1-_3)-arabinofuranosyltransferase family protein [Nitrososphaerota archaeon]
MNSDIVLKKDLFTWSDFQLGQPSIEPARFLYAIAWWVMQRLNIPYGCIQIIFYMLCYTGGGIAMYYLTRIMFPNQKYASFFASTFYMLNIVLVLWFFHQLAHQFTYFCLPLLLLLLVWMIEKTRNGKNVKATILLFAITSVPLFSITTFNVAHTALILSALVFTATFYFITEKSIKKHIFINLIKVAILASVLNLWWVIPYLVFPHQQLSSSVIEIDKWAWTHQRASFLNLFWLNAQWAWRPEYYPFINTYRNPILIVLTFLPIVLAFSSLLFKKSPLIVYYSAIILLCLFLAKGLHPPLDFVNRFFYENIPGMFLFRNPVDKFTMFMLPFLALLIGFACDNLISKIKKSRLKFFISFFIILTFMVTSFPLITGEVIPGQCQFLPSAYVEFPSYWFEAAKYLQSEEFRVLLTPNDDFYQMPYTWGYYGSDGFPSRLISMPVIQTLPGGYFERPESTLISEIYEAIRNGDSAKFQSLINLFSVRYILHRDDIDADFPGRRIMKGEIIKEFLRNQKNIKPVQSFGELTLYEYLDYKPRIYIPRKIIVVNGSLGNLTTSLSSSVLDPQQLSIIFFDSRFEQVLNKILQYSDGNEVLNYTKVNPTLWKARVNASKPFILSFSESYDSSWEARIYKNGKLVEKVSPIPLYGIINGFPINATGENLEVVIRYTPQDWFETGLAVSGLAFTFCLLYLFYDWRRRKGDRWIKKLRLRKARTGHLW